MSLARCTISLGWENFKHWLLILTKIRLEKFFMYNIMYI